MYRSGMIERHSNLLGAAARLYERHRSNRPRPFNVFAVLRSASDEVNLHSRFLHALLDVVDPLSGKRENLEVSYGRSHKRPISPWRELGFSGSRITSTC